MQEVPSASVTFLFTDIEGSTRLWERHPAEMRVALARHDALLRAAIQRHGGRIFSTAGDAFCAAFGTAPSALAAALDGQLALVSERWPDSARINVRMALHTGEADRRDNDYFGPSLNRVARLLAAAHGGQVLASSATWTLLQDHLPPGVALRDMGDRRLKDLIRAERVYELAAPGLPGEFPPLKTLDARAHNLPVQANRFVGRDNELRELKEILRAKRLLTLTGAGGAGKTRLALQLAADVIDDYADGVRLVELAPLGDARLVAQATAAVLGVKEQAGAPITDTLVDALRGQEILLLLDNCEHLVEACAELCAALLSRCARIRILATSRETLRIPGETPYRVPSLPAPEPGTHAAVEVVTQYAAVQLFVDRAQSVKPAFRVDRASAPAIAQICHRLDGIPLALELAAARLRSMTIDELDRRLDDRFRLLTRGSRTALPRQQTLRALIDWSYDLLAPAERTLFRRLAVFAGGFALAAAERVCCGDGCDEEAIVDLVGALADKSLMAADEHTGATRYRMLETVRQYAQARLDETDDASRWRDAHLAHFVAVAEEAEPHLTGSEQSQWLDHLDANHDNLRAALLWSVRSPSRVGQGLRLAGALWHFWQVRGYQREGRDHYTALLAEVEIEHDARVLAKAYGGAGNLAWLQGDYAAARSLFEQSLCHRRSTGDRIGVARTLSNLGNVAREQADYDTARALQEESIAIRRELGDQWGVAAGLCNLGLVASDRGDYATARALQGEALVIMRELGDRRTIAGVSYNIGEIAIAQGDLPAAQQHYEESLAIFRELGDLRGISISLTGLAQIRVAQADVTGARALHAESLALKRKMGDRRGIAISLESLAHLESVRGAPRSAALLWGAAERLREDIEAPLPPNERAEYDRQVAGARATARDDDGFVRAWQQGRALTLSQALEHALEATGETPLDGGRRTEENHRA